jgi:serine/threonine protein kinase
LGPGLPSGPGPTRGPAGQSADWPKLETDRYVFKAKIGQGGQGDVWLAHDRNLSLDVAIKILLQEYRSEEFVERFKTEAVSAVRLDATNIVRIYDFRPEHPYLVMEYCESGDLLQLLKSRRRLPVARLLQLVGQICDALIVAHEHGVLHRDLKPANVLFKKGVPKVADFGLAKVLGGPGGRTTTRGMMGTLSYAAPEQLKDASSVDARADIWSLGVMLYELLTWSRPFDRPGDDFVNVALRVRLEPPFPTPYVLPGPVASLLDRALAKDPADRFASARAMRAAIDFALAELPDAETLLLPPETHVDEASRLAGEVAAGFEEGRPTEARAALDVLKTRAPEHSLVRYWERRLRQISSTSTAVDTEQNRRAAWLESRLESIQSMIVDFKYRDARRQIGELLVDDPDNTLVQRVLAALVETERRLREDLERAHADADQARARGEPQRALAAWEDFQRKYPNHPDARTELAVARREVQMLERQRARTGVEARARAALEGGDLELAEQAWADYLRDHPDDAEAARSRAGIAEDRRRQARAATETRLRAEAERAQEAGNLAGARDIWSEAARQDPAWDLARTELEAAEAALARREQEDAIRAARERARQAEARGDLVGVLACWQEVLTRWPGQAEAMRESAAAARALEVERSSRALAALDAEAAALERRVGEGRYRSLPELAGAIRIALERVRDPGLREGAQGVETSTRDLRAVSAAAERTLQDTATAARRTLLRLVAQAHATGEAGAEVLEAAVRGLAAEDAGDPIEAATSAAEVVTGWLRSREQARSESREQASREVGSALRLARAALAELESEDAAAARDLGERLAALSRQAEAEQEDLAPELRSIASQATALRLAGGLQAEVRLHDVVLQAERLLPSLPDGLLAQRTAEALSASVAHRREAAARLASELDQARGQLQRQRAEAEARWTSAMRAWDEFLASELGATLRRRASEVPQPPAAPDTDLPEDAFRRCRQLEVLTARCRYESVWLTHAPEVRAVQERLEEEGSTDRKLSAALGTYRRALASGDAEGMRAAFAPLQRGLGGEEPVHGTVPSVPARLDSRLRRFNLELKPGAVQAFEEARDRAERAIRERDALAAAQACRDAEDARSLLLSPGWLPSVPILVAAAGVFLAVALVAVGIAAGWIGGESTQSFALGTFDPVYSVRVNGEEQASDSTLTVPSETPVRLEVRRGERTRAEVQVLPADLAAKVAQEIAALGPPPSQRRWITAKPLPGLTLVLPSGGVVPLPAHVELPTAMTEFHLRWTEGAEAGDRVVRADAEGLQRAIDEALRPVAVPTSAQERLAQRLERWRQEALSR